MSKSKDKQIDRPYIYYYENKLVDKNLATITSDTEVKKTKSLLKDNICLTEQLYDKLESGELKKEDLKEKTITLKKFPNIIKLFESKPKLDINNIKLMAEEINDSDNDEKKSKHSNSSNSLMDFDVVGGESQKK
jgi:hypothetical protein